MTSEIQADKHEVTLMVYLQAKDKKHDGRHQYAFSNDSVTLRKSPVEITYRLSGDTADHYEIEDIVACDPFDQIETTKIDANKRSITLINRNTRRTIIVLSVLVRDTTSKELINCDPQMTNVPPI